MRAVEPVLLAWAAAAFRASSPTGACPKHGRGRGLRRAEDTNFALPDLQARIDEMRERQRELPVLVFDSMLPGQRLTLASTDGALREMAAFCAARAVEEGKTRGVEEEKEEEDEEEEEKRPVKEGGKRVDEDGAHAKEEGESGSSPGATMVAEEGGFSGGTFGMVGRDLRTGRELGTGVEVLVVNSTLDAAGRLTLEVQAGRRFLVDEAPPMPRSGGVFSTRRVTLAPDYDAGDEAEAAAAAADLPTLVATWQALVLRGGHERVPDHLGRVCADLGVFPAKWPSAQALWVGAYINPLPGLGVSLEIRPALLEAQTASERVAIAKKAIQASIGHLDGSKRLW